MKQDTREEFNAALRGGRSRIIPVQVDEVDLPSELDGVSYADTSKNSADAISIHVSQALETRIGQPVDVSISGSRIDLSDGSVVALDNPRQPYSLTNVEFFDTGEKYFIDTKSNDLEFDDPVGYLNRGIGEISDGNAFLHITKDMILQAKSAVRTLIKTKEASGWPIFNGQKFGVARLRRTRAAESEHHRLLVNVYETDYYTSLFSKKLYALLSPDRKIRVDQNGNYQEYQGNRF